MAHPVAVARRANRRRIEGSDEAGFTLIELIITIAILPIVVGAISVALLSVFNLQGSASSRLSDSNDELVSASVFNKDVQSAQEIETATTPACGTSGQTQIVGLEWGLDTNGHVPDGCLVRDRLGRHQDPASPPGLQRSPLSPFHYTDQRTDGLS